MTGSAARPAATLILLALLGVAHPAGAQRPAEDRPACPAGTIGTIFVENRSIYQQAGPEEDEPLGRIQGVATWIADRLHRRTRRELIESELLFEAGDCLDQLLLDESERILRSLPFIAEADIQAVRANAGEVLVFVDTKDDWTLKLDIRPEFDRGVRIGYAGVTEENLWGTGTLLGVYFREQDEQRDLGMQARTVRLARTRADAVVSAGRTRKGVFFTETVSYPFVGEIGRWAFLESYSMREGLFPYATPEGSSFSTASLPMQTRRAEATVGRRFGKPGNLIVLGAGLSWEDLRFDGFPEDVELVSRFDYSTRDTADAATIEAIRHQVARRGAVRFNLVAGKRNIRFITRRGLDAVTGEQDVRVGTQALAAVGTTLGKPELGAEGRGRELRGNLSLFGGSAGENWVFNSELALEGAWLPGNGSAAATYRDVLARFDTYFYLQPDSARRHTVVVGLGAAGGWDNARPFQLTLGGPFGVRGYDRLDFPAARRVVVSVEDRIRLGSVRDLFDVGLAVFVDAGKGWRGGVPFGADSGMRAAAGAGLRFAPPSGARQVVRFDLAVPVHAGGLRDSRFRISYDATSLLAPLRDRQMQRSRGAGPSAVLLGGR